MDIDFGQIENLEDDVDYEKSLIGELVMPYWVETEVVNPTDKKQTFTIPKGRMISPKNLRDKVQNLVVLKDTKVTIPPKGKAIVTVPTDCTDPNHPPPSNTTMEVSIFGQKKRPDKNIFPGRSMR
ncbi:MAG: hypothetical protein AB4372_29970 [Xenococcus sp. (in: cyanobacteria)]